MDLTHEDTEALRRERDLRDAVFAAVGFLLVVFDRDGRIVSFNRACEELTGFACSEVEGKVFWELFIAPEELAAVRETFRQLTAGSFPLRHENDWVTRQGVRKRIAWSNDCILDGKGQVELVIGTGVDVSEERKAKESLHNAMELLETVTRETKVIIATRDLDLRYTYFNRAHAEELERLTGKPPRIGMSLAEQFDHQPAEAAVAIEKWSRTLRGESQSYTIEFGDPGFYRGYYSILHTPIRDLAGNVVGVGEIGWDVSEAKRNEKALAESERRHRNLLELMPECVAVHQDGTYVYMNPAGLNLFGAGTPEQVIGRKVLDFVHPDYRDEVGARIEKAMSGASTPLAEVVLLRVDGQPIIVESMSTPVSWNGRPASQGMLRNVTERKRVEEELRRSTELLRARSEELATVLDAVPVAVWIAHDPQCLRITGNRYADEIVMRVKRRANISASAPPGEAAVSFKVFRDGVEMEPEQLPAQVAAATGKPVAEEVLELRFADGRTVYLLEGAMPLFDVNGRVRGSVASASDVTALKRAEEDLRNKESFTRLITDCLPTVVAYVDTEGRYVWANKTYERWYGLVPQTMIGRHIREVHGEALWESTHLNVERALAGEALSYEFEKHEEDGTSRWIRSSYVPDREESGAVRGFVALGYDITERKRAERAMQTMLQRLYLVLSSMYAAALLVTEDGRVEFANQAFLSRFGLRGEGADFVGAESGEMIARVKDTYLDSDRAVTRIREIVDRGQPVTGEEIAMRGGVTVLRDFIPLDVEGKPGGRLWLHTDITKRKQAEEALRELNATLDERVRERTMELERRAVQLRALAAEVARAEERERKRLARVLHDHLQQLLVAAKFAAASLRGRVNDELKIEVQRVQDILGQSIDASRSLTTELSPPILHEGGLASGLPWLARWMRENHGLEVTMSITVSPESLSEDMGLMLFQAVRELLFNVVKHAGVKKADVTLTHEDGKHLKVVVADQGRGFDGNTSGGSFPDSFGLFSIRERLAYVDGRMDVDSRPGHGTRVTLTVPMSKMVQASPARTPTVMVASVSPDVAPGVIRLLVVDDHTVVRKGLVELLRKEPGLSVVGEAADGREAVENAHRLLPDVVLMDVTMPVMDGVEATRRISAELPAVRVIGLSMHTGDDMAAWMRAAGAVNYLIKDGPVEDLVAAIRSAAEKPAVAD
jgi:PAS domain S-box-containing protein